MGRRCGHEKTLAAERANDKRDIAELLRSRTHLLCGSDRALLQMYLEHGNSLRQMARMAGASPGAVSRRIRRIARRLADETYPLCLAGRDEFTGRELALVRDCFVRGLPMTRVSREHGVSYHRVRAAVHKAREYARSARGREPPVRRSTALTASACNPVDEGTHDDNV
jgi:DNA-directed RNA polymerase specialized sigma24 family protein